MRKIGIILAALACVTSMAFAAQAAVGSGGEDMKGQFAIGATGGLAMPMGKLGEKIDLLAETTTDEGLGGADMKMGTAFGAHVDYFITKEFAIGLDASYVTMSMNDQTILGTTYKDLVKAKTMQFGVHGKYFVPTGGPLVPYLSLGAGMYSRKLELSNDFQQGMDVTESEFTDSKPGVNAGVGIEYKVNPMFGIGASGIYNAAMGKFKHDFGSGTEETVLKDWTYTTFSVALTYHIPMAKK